MTAPVYDCPPARVLVADPPWLFGDRTPHKGAEDHYACLPLPQIIQFPLPPIADNAVLFLWRVGAGNDEGSLGEGAYAVARAWGFTPRSEMVWRKTRLCKNCGGNGWTPIAHAEPAYAEVRVWCETCHGRGYKVAIGMGRYVRGAHEVCLIATRGKRPPVDKSVRSVFDAPRQEHSRKPDRFYDIVEKLYPEGPHVELFARRGREGWHCYGDQITMEMPESAAPLLPMLPSLLTLPTLPGLPSLPPLDIK
jgi:N6-adenosine-specific RNA methylase IME4